MLNTIIISGGNVDREYLKEELAKNKFDIIIAADNGLKALDECNILPNYIIGDFDSLNDCVLKKYIDNKKIKITKLNPIKDYTDTHMAIKLAIELKSTDITIIGGTGTRIDHTISNIEVLKEALDFNIPCKILDKNNCICLINKNINLIKDEEYKYISLIPFTNKVTQITLKGFKYNVNNVIIEKGESIGISNEQIDKEASIEFKEGILILIKSKD